MYDVWKQRKQSKEQAQEVIKSLIDDNYNAIEEHVIEFLDDAVTGDKLLESLEVLKRRRNRLFEVCDDLEEDIEWLSNVMSEIAAVEFPARLPEERK